MASLRWKNYSACLGLLLGRVSCLLCASPLLQMLPPKPYLQLSGRSTASLTMLFWCADVLLAPARLLCDHTTRTAILVQTCTRCSARVTWYGAYLTTLASSFFLFITPTV